MTAEPDAPAPTRTRLVAYAVVVAAALLAVLPVIVHAALPDASDTAFTVLCARGFSAAFREGVLYPRWIGDANSGFGAPTFVIYPPVGYYLVALAELATGDTIAAIRCVLVLGSVVSAVVFYVSARDVATEAAAAAGAAFYALLPYHLLDVYERCAFAEFLAFMWFPILFRAARELARGPSAGAWLALAVGYAGLVTTHVITAYAALFVLVPYTVYVAWRARRWSALAYAASAGAVALVCCGAYLLPVLVERHDTNFVFYLGGKAGWWTFFLLRDETAFGVPLDATKPLVTAGAIVTLLVTAVVAWFSRARAETRAYAALVGWTFFLETPASTPLWAVVPGLALVHYVWRFEAFGLLSAALAVAVALRPPRAPGLASALAAVGVLALGVSTMMTFAHAFTFDRAESLKDENRLHFIPEHMPAGVNFSDPWARLPWVQPEAYVPEGGSFETLAWTAQTRRVRVSLPADGPVVLRTYSMTGWETRLDGAPATHRPDARFGAIEVDVPAGTHEIEAVYGSTWDRRAGAAVSAVGIAILLGVAAVALRRP